MDHRQRPVRRAGLQPGALAARAREARADGRARPRRRRPDPRPSSNPRPDSGPGPGRRAAERAAQAGTPKPDVAVVEPEEAPAPAVGEAPAAGGEPRKLSRTQEKLNREIQQAVDRATTALQAENARLKALAAPPKTEPATPVDRTPAAPAKDAYKRYLQAPGAPKLADFDTLEDHAAAMALFMADARHAERVTQDAHARAVVEAEQKATATITGFQQQVTEAGGKDFLAKLHPEVQALRPVEALEAAGELHQAGPLNVLASELVKSARAPQLLQQLSAHPELLQRFRSATSVAEVYRHLGALESALDAPSDGRPHPKTVTSAPAPIRTLDARSGVSSDPALEALQRDNFRAFRLAERARERAS